MFTGEYRYIHKNLCKEVKFEKDLSNLPHPSIDIFFAFVRAEDQALRDADQKLPPAKNVYKNIEINRVLEDRYKLKVCHKFAIQPPIYSDIVWKHVNNEW